MVCRLETEKCIIDVLNVILCVINMVKICDLTYHLFELNTFKYRKIMLCDCFLLNLSDADAFSLPPCNINQFFKHKSASQETSSIH